MTFFSLPWYTREYGTFWGGRFQVRVVYSHQELGDILDYLVKASDLEMPWEVRQDMIMDAGGSRLELFELFAQWVKTQPIVDIVDWGYVFYDWLVSWYDCAMMDNLTMFEWAVKNGAAMGFSFYVLAELFFFWLEQVESRDMWLGSDERRRAYFEWEEKTLLEEVFYKQEMEAKGIDVKRKAHFMNYEQKRTTQLVMCACLIGFLLHRTCRLWGWN